MKLEDICKDIKLEPQHCVEIGVGLPHQTRMQPFMGKCRVEMFEALPEYYRANFAAYGLISRLSLYHLAMWHTKGTIKIYSQKDSSFLEGINSPHCANDGYRPSPNDAIEVACDTYDQYDDGTVDLLAVDTEGAEWHVINVMKSRPRLIAVETHNRNYSNPFLKEIEKWMADNKYRLRHREDRNGSDSFYVL